MKRIGTILWLCVLLGFGWNVSGAWAFNKKPALPSSKVSAVQSPQVLNVTEDISARTLHSKRWRTEGTSSYTEIHPGLHVLSSDSKYKNADTTLTATPDGAEAKQLNHPVRFKNELSYGRPTVEQGDPKNPVLQASPALIVYRDLSTDRSVVLARSKPASLTFEKNIATYKDAFDYLRADVRYTVRAGNLEQDVLLYEKPLKPSDYGLNDETTVLAVMTQVFSLEDQVQSGATIQSPSTRTTLAQSVTSLKTLMTPRIAGPIVLEQDGKAIQQFARSYVFSKNSKQAVHKRLVTVQGIHFLVEESPASYFQEQGLPVTQGPKVSQHIPFTQLEVLANANFTPETKDRLAQVRPTLISAPIVIDFISVTGTVATDFTFAQGETYLVDGPVTMTGVTTFEGGATIKFNSTGSLDVSDPVFNTSSSNWVVFTSQNDDSVGEVVAGSTGSPSSYPNALTLAKGSVRFVQIRYADDGIVFPGNETLTVQDSEFLAVRTPVNASSSAGVATVNLNNLLIVQGTNGPVLTDDGTNALTVTANNITMADLTGDGFSNITTASGSSLSVTDSLFVDLQGTSTFAGTPPTEDFNAFFQTPQNGTGANDVALTANPILTDWFLDQASPVINAGSQSASSAGLYHYNTNADGTLEGPTTVDIGYHFPPSISQFSVLATNSIWLKSNSMVSGDIGVNEATAGPFLDSNVALAVGHDMVIPAAINLRADSIKIKTGAVVNGNVYHNQLENNGTINGTELTPIVFPILDVLPLFRSATLGTVSDINVAAGTTHVLAPGDYGVITVNNNATLQFTGGLYQIQKIDAKKTTSLLFDAPSEVRIVENLVTKRFSTLGPSTGATLSAGDIQFFVEGTDVGNQRAVDFGHTHTVVGHFYAPNGTLGLKRQSTFSGIFLAKDIMIGHDSQVVLDPGTGQPIVAAPVISPNGGSFFDSVEVNLSTITSGATIHYTTDGTDPDPTTSPTFTGPFTLTTSATPQTVKAIAVRDGFIDSNITTSSDFIVQAQPVAQVAISPASGTFQDFVFITMTTATPGAEIFYTTDGSDPSDDPTSTSTLYEFSFSLNASGTVRAVAIKDGFMNSPIVGETYTINAVQANTLSGRILDANALANTGVEVPIVGVIVSLLNTGVSATSGADGVFTLNNVPLGDHPLDLDATSLVDGNGNPIYASFREEFNIQPGLNVVGRPLFLPQLDSSSLTTIDPLVETIVTNPNLGVSVIVPAASAKNPDGTNFTGQLSISEVPRGLAPATLPEELDPGLLLTLQPVGITFSTPARISAPNIDQLPTGPGEEVNIWSLDPTTAEFKIVGTNSISTDGTTLEWKSGGIPSTGWHHFVPIRMEAAEIAGAGASGENNDPGEADKCVVGSLNVVQTGELIVEHDLVTYRSFGINRNLKFVYDSLAADPHPIVSTEATVRSVAGVPPTISSTLRVDKLRNGIFSEVPLGDSQEFEVFTSTAGFSETINESSLKSVQFDATDLPTGRYPYLMKVTSNYVQSRVSNFSSGNTLVNNEQDSPFGAGWMLDGLQRVHPQSDTSALLTEGDGGAKFFFTKEGVETGTFPSTITTTGLNLSTIFLFLPGDVNGDGFADIVEAVRNTNTVTVRFGDGAGGFSAPLNIFMGAGIIPEFVNIVRDLNNDNVNDLATFNRANNSISIILSNGSGGFLPPTFIPVANGPLTAAFEDFDGDGIRDIVVSNSLSSTISLLLGDGNGGYALSNTFVTEPNTGGVISRDFNGDGHLDILTTHTPSTNFSLLFGDGAGNFSPHIVVSLSSTLFSWQIADFNGDGKIDFVTGDGSTIEINLGDGTGSFLLANTIQFPLSGGFGFVPRDFNDDGIIDLAVTHSLSDDFFIYLGTGNGQFGPPTVFGNGTVGQQFRVGDVNGDSVDDFIYKPVGDLTNLTIALGTSDPTAPPGEFSKLVKNDIDDTFLRTMKDGTKHNFDANGFHTSTADRNGNTTRYIYDPAGLLTKIVDPTEDLADPACPAAGVPAQGVTCLFYTTGKLSSVIDPAGRETQFVVDASGDLTQITDPDGSFRVFGYDAQHHLTLQKSKRGFDTTYTYDFAGRNTGSVLPDTSTRLVSPVQTVGLANITSGVGTQANPALVVRPTEAVASFTDGNGNVTKFEVDAFGKSTKVEDPLNPARNLVRDANGLVTQIIEPNGAFRINTWDSRGNLLTTGIKPNATSPTTDEVKTSFEHEPDFSNITKITDPENNTVTFNYDSNGNPIELIDALLTKGKLEYNDPNCPGKPTRFISALSLPEETTVTQQYDPVTCNLVKIIDHLAHETLFEYDSAGNISKITDAKLKVTRAEYDSMNQLVRSIDATNSTPSPACGLSGVTCFTYDEAGNQKTMTDANGNITSWDYDALDRTAKRTDPLASFEMFQYDGQGNLRFLTDRKNQVVEFQYDVANQIKKRILLPGDPNEEIANFDYDNRGNLILANDADSNISAVYDFLNRIKEISTTGSPSQPATTLKYTYDKNGNRKTLDDGVNTVTTNYVYDALNRLDTLTTPDSQIFDFDYDVLSRRKLLTLPNGTTTDYQYDDLDQLKNLSHKLNTTVKSSFAYTYGPVGNRDTLTTVRSNVAVAQTNLTYHYDDLNRLDIATRPLVGDPDETFQYDPVGNRKLRDGQTFTAVHNLANQLSEDEDFSYTYDLNGNLTRKENKTTGEVTDFTWDVQNQLIKIEEKPDALTAPTQTVEFKYDAAGRRIQKKLNGIVTAKYVYDDGDILFEYDSADVLLASYIHGPRIDEPLRMQRGGVGYFYNADGLGSITELVDTTGNIVQSYIYDSFGNINVFDQGGAMISPSGGIANPFTYTGRELDTETGLYYYRARYYDSNIGRFISEDPIGFDGGDPNLYRYVFSDPIGFGDPEGLCGLCIMVRPVPIIRPAPFRNPPSNRYNPAKKTPKERKVPRPEEPPPPKDTKNNPPPDITKHVPGNKKTGKGILKGIKEGLEALGELDGLGSAPPITNDPFSNPCDPFIDLTSAFCDPGPT